MTLREIVENIKKSEIFKLRSSDNTIIGYRIKIFNVNSQKFEYYDFGSKVQGIDKITSIVKDWGYIDVSKINNLWLSQAEIDKTITVLECKSLQEVESIINKLFYIYKYKEEPVNV